MTQKCKTPATGRIRSFRNRYSLGGIVFAPAVFRNRDFCRRGVVFLLLFVLLGTTGACNSPDGDDGTGEGRAQTTCQACENGFNAKVTACERGQGIEASLTETGSGPEACLIACDGPEASRGFCAACVYLDEVSKMNDQRPREISGAGLSPGV